MKNTSGIGALGASGDNTRSRTKIEKEAQKAHEWFLKQGVLIGIIVLLSLSDGFSLFLIFHDILIESPVFLVVVVGSIALSMNFIPILLAHLARKRYYKLERVSVWALAALVATFLLIWGAVVVLRLQTRQMDFLSQTSLVQNLYATQNEAALESPAALPLSIVLCIAPFVTSVINTFLGWIATDPVQIKLNRLRLERLSYFENLCELRAAQAEMESPECDPANLYQEEAKALKTQLNTLVARREKMRSRVRCELALHLKYPEEMSGVVNYYPDKPAPPNQQPAYLNM